MVSWRSARSKKTVHSGKHPLKPARLKLVRDTEWDEWQVRWYYGNTWNRDKTYYAGGDNVPHQSDASAKKDAEDTMVAMQSEINEYNRKHGFA